MIAGIAGLPTLLWTVSIDLVGRFGLSFVTFWRLALRPSVEGFCFGRSVAKT